MSQGAVTGAYNTNQMPYGADPSTWQTYDKSLQIHTPALTEDGYRKNMLMALSLVAIVFLIIYLLKKADRISAGLTKALIAGIIIGGGMYLGRERSRLNWYAQRSIRADKPDPQSAALMLKDHSGYSLLTGYWTVCHTIDYWYYMDSIQMATAANQYNQWTGKNAVDQFEAWKTDNPCQIGQNDKIERIINSIIERL